MRSETLLALFAVALMGCSDPGSKGSSDMAGVGSVDGAAIGPDMTPAADMVDTTPIPAPTIKHVGATGVTCCIVTDGNAHAAYLAAPSPLPNVSGTLHVTKSDGTDVQVAAPVPAGGFVLAPDGKSILFTKAANTSNALYWADVTGATVTPKQIVATGFPTPQITPNNFFTPSGHFFVFGVLAPNVASSPDLHVVDVRTGTDVYQRLNGAFQYVQVVLPDDTMLLQDTAGGTGMGMPPVQTLYWVALPGTTPAAAITTRTASFAPTADNKTLIILKTNGDLLTWDLTTKTGAGNKIASGVATFSLGRTPTGPIAYLGADRSVHVLGTDGAKLLELPATAAADLFGPVILTPDSGHAYFFQNVDTQDNRGTLLHVAVSSGATASKVADKVSLRDLSITDNAIVFLQNVDDLGQFGDAAKAALDGSGVALLGMKANVGGLKVVNPGPDTWFAMHLTGAAIDTANSTIDGSQNVLGGLGFADYTGASEIAVDPKVHAGTFAFSDNGRDAVFVTAAAFNATAGNYVGSLGFIATRAPSTKIDGMLSGVSEVGTIVSRSLFVNAPTATPAGVYFISY